MAKTEIKKIKKLTVRQITLIDIGFNSVAGLSFPTKTKYKCAKIQDQISRVIRSMKDTKTELVTKTIAKYKIKKNDEGNDAWTDEANRHMETELLTILDKEEEISGGIYPFTIEELDEAEDWIKDWNDNIKSKDQPSIAIPNNFYTLLFPIIIDNEE